MSAMKVQAIGASTSDRRRCMRYSSLVLDCAASGAPAPRTRRFSERSGRHDRFPAWSVAANGARTPQQIRADDRRTGSIVAAEEIASGYAEAATGDPERVCNRFVMRVIEAPLPDGAGRQPLLNGPALIVGENPSARALQQRLEQVGVKALMIPTADNSEQVLSELDAIWNACQPLHLFLMTPHDEDAITALNADDWNRRRMRGVMIPYLICQKWYGLVAGEKLLDKASLVAATTMGGDFGFSGGLPNIESGGLAGLLKGVDMELKMQVREEQFRTKIVDAAATIDPSVLAECLCDELAANDGEIEVGYIDGRRYLPRPVVQPVDRGIPPDAAGGLCQPSDIPRGATFIITGGARGVTAVVARELGKRYGLKLNLIGSSPAPDVPDAYLDLSAAESKDLRATVMKEALANGEKPLDVWERFEKSVEIARTLKSFA
ncbi:MAG: hypothetical protein IH986_17780, partial [Planctomycetes bacterium]|nr:hypothetical protein [Planctomycetota bacterium]